MDWVPPTISGFSATIALLALVLTWHYHPKPHLLIEWPDVATHTVNGVIEFTCVIRNVGNAPASDLQLSVDLVATNPRSKWLPGNELNPGERFPGPDSFHEGQAGKAVDGVLMKLLTQGRSRSVQPFDLLGANHRSSGVGRQVSRMPDNELFRAYRK